MDREWLQRQLDDLDKWGIEEPGSCGYVPHTVVVNKRSDEPYDVYVGRPTKWGNPFKVGIHGAQGECVIQYAEWIRNQPQLLADLDELRGKRLACWCAPKPCHANVLAYLADYGHLIDLKTSTWMAQFHG